MATYVGGLDLGSRQVKIVLAPLKAPGIPDFKAAVRRVVSTMPFYRRWAAGEGQIHVDFEALGLPVPEVIVSTGYGRNLVSVQGAQAIPELKAHTLGAVYQTGEQDFILVDLGGQDSKVIVIQGGAMVDFMTNDKCAASSGRYLENMAAALAMSVQELGDYSDSPAPLSATCAIFGESELIGKIAAGVPIPALAAGVNASVVQRLLPLLARRPPGKIVFSGGVAYNQAVGRLLADLSGCEVVIPREPQFNGAIGCCLYGAR